jgi:plastocyanin
MEPNDQNRRSSISTLLWILLIVAAVAGVIAFARSRNANSTPEDNLQESAFNSATTGSTGNEEIFGAGATNPSSEVSPSPNISPTVTPSVTPAMSPSPSATNGENIKEFVVTGTNYKYDVTSITVNRGDTVRIIFKSAEGTHDWSLDRMNVKTRILNTGEQDTVQFTVTEPGQYEYYCSVGNHTEMGMRAMLVVL